MSKAIRKRRVGNAVYLEEYRSHRVEGKVVESSRIIDRVSKTGSRRSGEVGLLWSIAQDLEIPDIIDGMASAGSSISPGKVITAWAINRVIDPESATQLES